MAVTADEHAMLWEKHGEAMWIEDFFLSICQAQSIYKENLKKEIDQLKLL